MKRKLQVFVSSTFTDLVAERQAAVAAILKAGHIPAGMELFTAGDKSQLETIKKWIDESDAYMLILGGRYGSIEATSGISYTELEYDYALQQDKPLFAVVIRELALENKVKAIGTPAIEQDYPKALKQFRDKVLSNVSSFFDDDKDIKLCVHESLADLRDNPNIPGWISATDVEDTKPLHEEIAKLRSEVDRLQKLAAKAPRAAPKPAPGIGDDAFRELMTLLNETEVSIPPALAEEKKDVKNDLLALFINNKAPLLNGVDNRHGIDDATSFLYFNICPKLMVHGLVNNEKIAGVRYRRSFVSEQGRAFLAEWERRMSKSKSEKKAEVETTPAPSIESAPVVQAKPPRKRRTKAAPAAGQD